MEKVEEEGGDLCSLNNCIKCKVHQSNAIFGRNVSYEGGGQGRQRGVISKPCMVQLINALLQILLSVV